MRPQMYKSQSVQHALLLRARDFAGGVSYLARRLGIGVHSLDGMLSGNAQIPQWVFLRAVEFCNEREEEGTPPPGFPANWQDTPDDTTKQ